jgi:hypothetical protein
MDQQVLVALNSSYRNTARAAITSGVIGIAAFGLLMDAVLTRVSWIPPARIYMLFNAHDIGVALQFLLLISVAFGLRTLSRQSPPGLSSFVNGYVSRTKRAHVDCVVKPQSIDAIVAEQQ